MLQAWLDLGAQIVSSGLCFLPNPSLFSPGFILRWAFSTQPPLSSYRLKTIRQMLIGPDCPTFGPAPNPEPVSGARVMGCLWPDGGQVLPVEPGGRDGFLVED